MSEKLKFAGAVNTSVHHKSIYYCPTMTKALRAHIFLFIVNLFYGAGFSVSKMVMPEFIQPFGFIFIRVSVTTVLFFILHFFWMREQVERKDWLLLAVCGLFGVVINQEMFFLGLSRTTPINASLIMIMTPILVFVISFFLMQENASWQKILGLVLGVSGALLILAGKGFSFSAKPCWAICLF
jgi:drug/metabolite transporter (DMT)-like permease